MIYGYQTKPYGLSNVEIWFSVECLKDPISFYAMFIYECMKGVHTDDSNFIRLIVSRSEVNSQYTIPFSWCVSWPNIPRVSDSIATIQVIEACCIRYVPTSMCVQVYNKRIHKLLQTDLQLIIDEYGRTYKESLTRAIQRNCAGDYCRIMLRLIGEKGWWT